jgi:hypothetical protein
MASVISPSIRSSFPGTPRTGTGRSVSTSTCRPGATRKATRGRASAPTTGATSRCSPFSYMGDTGWEASAKLMYNIKSKNKDYAGPAGVGSYASGDEFHMDYLVGKRMGPWGVGLSGYYLKQTSDDEINGQTVAANRFWSEGPPWPGLRHRSHGQLHDQGGRASHCAVEPRNQGREPLRGRQVHPQADHAALIERSPSAVLSALVCPHEMAWGVCIALRGADGRPR